MHQVFFEHKCLNNKEKIYHHAHKSENQQNRKNILDADMVYNPQEVTDDKPSLPMTSTTVKKPSDRKSRCLFTNLFDGKNKTAKCCVRSEKSNRRAMKVGNSLWTNITKKGIKQSMSK